MLTQLTLCNFKSYRGIHEIPLTQFSCIIGPNGAGKSNLMDAVSFVLGVRSAALRSTQLADLVYRGANGVRSSDECYVELTYVDAETETAYAFRRNVSGTYSVNGEAVSFKRYSEHLEEFNVLIRARNFLVFQGDVERVASQSPQDLTAMIEEISGSIAHKKPYDLAKAAMEEATAESVAHHAQRRTAHTELKQTRDMRREAERFAALSVERDVAETKRALLSLRSVRDARAAARAALAANTAKLDAARAANAGVEQRVATARAALDAAAARVETQERAIRAATRRLDVELRPAVASADTNLARARAAIAKYATNAADLARDAAHGREKLRQLERDRKLIEEELERLNAEAAAETGTSVSAENTAEYARLRARALPLAAAERATLRRTRHALTVQAAKVAALEDDAARVAARAERLLSDEKALEEKLAALDSQIAAADASAREKGTALASARAAAAASAQREREDNEKLARVYTALTRLGAAARESARDAERRETLAALRRTFPGVRGRVRDLCRPVAQKYAAAARAVLGRHGESIVVDSAETAVACVAYLKLQRAGVATFLPLNSVRARGADERLKGALGTHARLALDVLQFAPALERAFAYVCGDAIVCDDMRGARDLVYTRGFKVKAVTLGGVVLHRGGNMSVATEAGDASNGAGDDIGAGSATTGDIQAQTEALRAQEATYKKRLAELAASRPRAGAEAELEAEIEQLAAEARALEESRHALALRAADAVRERSACDEQLSIIRAEHAAAAAEQAAIAGEEAAAAAAVAAAEATVYAEFCERLGLSSIAEYEEGALRGAEERNGRRQRLERQRGRLEQQAAFLSDDIAALEERRLRVIELSAAQERSITELEAARAAVTAEMASTDARVRALRSEMTDIEHAVDEALNAYNSERSASADVLRKMDRYSRRIAGASADVERSEEEWRAILRRCRTSGVKVPLLNVGTGGNSEESSGEADDTMGETMDTLDESATASGSDDVPFASVDFSSLSSDDDDETLAAAITELTAELARLAPNRNVLARLDATEARFRDVDESFEEVRARAQRCKDEFLAIKRKRTRLFSTAYEAIAAKIDPIYKQLTKGRASPMGGMAYLTLEDADEPYLMGVRYHAMPPNKTFRDMDQLSGGEKTMAAVALLFAINAFRPAPFFVLDEIDAALDNTNVGRLCRYIRETSMKTQFLVISLKVAFYHSANALVGVHRSDGSQILTLDLSKYNEEDDATGETQLPQQSEQAVLPRSTPA